jgi:hypothetical protein
MDTLRPKVAKESTRSMSVEIQQQHPDDGPSTSHDIKAHNNQIHKYITMH